MTSLLGCSVEGRWNEAPMELGVDTCTPSTVSRLSFSQFTWVKKTKKQGWGTILFLSGLRGFLHYKSRGPSRLGVTKEFIKLLHPLIPWATFDDGVHQVRAVREAGE